MNFADKIKALAAEAPDKIPHCKTEEATKAYLIQPFIEALGYKADNPMDVIPEFVADVDPRRVDRVDYAIMKDGKPIMLFECKAANSKLDRGEKWSQLFTYFIATDAKFGVLTNGVEYQFFSDVDDRNRMDKKPFLEFNLQEVDDSLIEDLLKFTKPDFDQNAVWKAARELKYTREIERILTEQLSNPSDEFIRFFVSKIYSGRRRTKPVMRRFAPLIQQAFNQFITDQVYERLKSAMEPEHGTPARQETVSAEVVAEDNVASPEKVRGVRTTVEELQGYYIVKSILHDVVDVRRIQMRDFKGFCGVLLDGSQQKTICRLRFNSLKNKRLGLIGSESRREERIPIDDLDDIYKYADRLKARVRSYVKSSIAA